MNYDSIKPSRVLTSVFRIPSDILRLQSLTSVSPIVSGENSSVPRAFLPDSSGRHVAGRRTAAVAQPSGASPEELEPHPRTDGSGLGYVGMIFQG